MTVNDQNKKPKKRGLIRRVWVGFWTMLTWLRISLSNLIFLLLLVVLIAALTGDRGPELPDRGALVLDPLGKLVEQQRFSAPLAALLGPEAMDGEVLLRELIRAINDAATDDRVELIVMPVDSLVSAGISKLNAVGQALQQFKQSGKPVIATADWLDQQSYLLASYADEIWLNPAGDMLLHGFGVYRNYYGEMLEKLGVNVHVFRAGSVKDAAEPLVSRVMSEDSKEANRRWLDDLWLAYTKGITERRQLPPESIDHYINEMDAIVAQYEGDGALAARQFGLVDELKTRDQMSAAIRQKMTANGDGEFPAFGLHQYLGSGMAFGEMPAEKPSVAVLVAQDMILPGEQPPGSIGADTLRGQIRSVIDDESIKAVVLRIDSPGGVMLAGEVIRNSLADLQRSGKPVVVSMGAVAASGGYQIAAAADEIWATPDTLTGSIGVIMQFPTVEGALGKLNVNNDGVGTTDISAGFNLARPLLPATERRLESSVAHAYRSFLNLVAEGRGLSEEKVKSAAEGQVWTGRQAQQLGLVDKLGGLTQAIASAAEMVNLQDYEVRYIHPMPAFGEQILGMLGGRGYFNIEGLFAADSILVKLLTLVPEPLSMKPGVAYTLCEHCVTP